MNENSQHDSQENLEAPAKLVNALKEASQSKVFVPPSIEETLFKAAREQLQKFPKNQFGHFYKWILWPALAVACVAILVAGRFLFLSHQPLYAREDLNRDGRVDILDSFALARQLKSGESLKPTLDVNGDGVVDERDVALIATHAVQLKKDNRS